MSLPLFVAVLRRRVWWLTVAVLLGIAAASGISLLTTPLYRAEASVFVSVDGGSTASDLSQGGSFAEARVASYAALVKSPSVLEAAARSAHVEEGVDALERSVTTTNRSDTVILRIAATQSDPERAAALANAVAEQTVSLIDEIEKTDVVGESLVKLSIYERAQPPSAPASPRIAANLALGVLLGLVVGIGSALLRETVDTKIRTVDELRTLSEKTVLAEIPVAEGITDLAAVDDEQRFSETAEAFRQLRTHLTFTNLDGGPQVVVVTSAVPGEGKSSVSVNLALMLAQNGHRTLLIDADLRRPTVSNVLGIESRVGLSTVLTHQVELEDALQLVGRSGLHVLSAGRVPPNPSELLSSPQMRLLLDAVKSEYDHIVIDAPPVLPVTDPAVLAAHASGVLFVSSVDGRVTRGEVTQALSTVDAVGARILGVVANRATAQRRPASYYGYEAVTPVSESPRRARRAADGTSS